LQALASLLPESLDKPILLTLERRLSKAAIKVEVNDFCHNAYHGNTMGSLSIMGFEERKQIFRPLIPDVDFITFNNEADLAKITTRTVSF
jgi:acetylornithine/succinyldiaminopimelate/putrescine aminotransferase